MQPIPEPLDALLKGALEPNERIHFTAQPMPVLLMRSVTPLAYAAFLPLLAALYVVGGVGNLYHISWLWYGSEQILLFPALLIASGALALLVWPMLQYHRALNMLYVVTDKAALILSTNTCQCRNVKRFSPAQIRVRRFDKSEDLSGSIYFSGRLKKTGFVGVPDVIAAETALRVLEQGAPTPRNPR